MGRIDLAHVPVPLFAAVMGWGGMTFVWRRGAEVLGLPAAVAEIMAFTTVALFVVVTALYAAKMAFHWRAVVAEFRHPVRVNFFACFTIDLMIVGGALLPHAPGAAEIFWALGAAGHGLFALNIIARWIAVDQEPATLNPAWFIPVVGNVLAPVFAVPLGHGAIGWFFFAVGMIWWLGLQPVMLNRLIFGGPLPPRVMPSLAILIAPPAVGFLAYHALTTGEGGGLDPVAMILFSAALFTGALLARLSSMLWRLPFSISWWAYTFPSAALTVASLDVLAVASDGRGALTVLAWVLVIWTTGIVALVSARTVGSGISGRLFVPE